MANYKKTNSGFKRKRSGAELFNTLFLPIGFFVAMALLITFAANDKPIGAAAAFGGFAVIVLAEVLIMTAIDRVRFSDKFDREKYIFTEGTVTDCYIIQNSTVNSKHLIMYKVKADVNGTTVTAYAREDIRLGTVLKLAVKINGNTAKILDENGNLCYSYKNFDVTKRRFDPVYGANNTEHDNGCDRFESVTDREDDLMNKLMEIDLFDKYEEYEDAAVDLWSAYFDEDDDESEAALAYLDKIDAIIDEYESKYLGIDHTPPKPDRFKLLTDREERLTDSLTNNDLLDEHDNYMDEVAELWNGYFDLDDPDCDEATEKLDRIEASISKYEKILERIDASEDEQEEQESEETKIAEATNEKTEETTERAHETTEQATPAVAVEEKTVKSENEKKEAREKADADPIHSEKTEEYKIEKPQSDNDAMRAKKPTVGYRSIGKR